MVFFLPSFFNFSSTLKLSSVNFISENSSIKYFMSISLYKPWSSKESLVTEPDPQPNFFAIFLAKSLTLIFSYYSNPETVVKALFLFMCNNITILLSF